MSKESQADLLKPDKAKPDDSSADMAQKSLQQEAGKALSSPHDKTELIRIGKDRYQSADKTFFDISIHKNVHNRETNEQHKVKPSAQPNDQNTHNIEGKTENVHQFDQNSLPVQEVK